MYHQSFKLVLLLIVCWFHNAQGLSVMSVDLGTEWMKVAIVSPGVPMEIALNRESQRKTPVAVAFREGERSFSDPAISTGIRFPDKAYLYLLDVIGKKVDNPIVELFRKRFPYYKIEASEDRETVVFKHPEGESFTPEELLAMMLKQAQTIAENAAGQPVKDAVLTVPPYFNQAERYAVWVAAQMSGINILQLINSNTATALNYGVFRRKDFNETPTNILFYDMGAGSTVATVVSYQLVKLKETGEVSPQLSIKGVGFDRTLGGLEMQLRLRDHFAKAFNAQKKTKSDVFKNSRAMAKLLKEAGRVKKVLSANTEHIAQVESLLDDVDFKSPITRAEFEELCSDLFTRAVRPIEDALSSAGLAMDHIDQIILAGSGARVPKIQQILLDFSKKSELGKSINTDESAALGAVYQAAFLSKGFKVKTFLIKDAAIYPIQVSFQRQFEQEDKTMGLKTVRRTLFSRNNIVPQKKAMTFNRLDKDFDFYCNYGDLNFLNELEVQSLGSTNLTKVTVTGVAEALAKHTEDKSEYKGVKAYFKMDENGYFHFDTVEALFEKVAEIVVEEEPANLQSTLAKLGDTIGKLFSSGETEEVVQKTTEAKPEEAPKAEDSKSDANTTEASEKDKSANETAQNDTVKKEEPAKKEPKLVIVKETLDAQKLPSDLERLSESRIDELKLRLKNLDAHDEARLAKDKTKNSLESFIVEAKHRLYSDEYEHASTDKERDALLTSLSEAGDWLEYESDEATTEIFKEKLSALRKLTRELFARVKEHQDRPEAVKALRDMLNISNIFFQGAKNMTEDEQIFTEVELKTLETVIVETEQWLNKSEKEQAETSPKLAPKLSIKVLSEKLANLDREVKYLLSKARFAQPLKKKKKPEETVTKDKSENITPSGSETTNDPDISNIEVPELPDVPLEDPSEKESSSTREPPQADKVKEETHSEL